MSRSPRWVVIREESTAGGLLLVMSHLHQRVLDPAATGRMHFVALCRQRSPSPLCQQFLMLLITDVLTMIIITDARSVHFACLEVEKGHRNS